MKDTRRSFLRTAAVRAASAGAASGLGVMAASSTVHAADKETECPSPRPWRDWVTLLDDHPSEASNWGGVYNRFRDQTPLKAYQEHTIAELEGPGVITSIRVRHVESKAKGSTAEEQHTARARGLTLLIYYNGASLPAVRVPFGDFFADGCGGRADYFSTPFLEKAPGAYACFIPMPFSGSAKIVVLNETAVDVGSFVFVEYERLPEWDDSLGFLHATWERREFLVRLGSEEELFKVEGRGHLAGLAWSIATDDPLFKDFQFFYSTTNNVRIDGGATEDAGGRRYAGAWGQGEAAYFNGANQGVNLAENAKPSLLSLYEFRFANPLRFSRELDWRINWGEGLMPRDNRDLERLIAQTAASGGGWVDFATTFYWYQSHVGYDHALPRRVEERMKPVMHPNP